MNPTRHGPPPWAAALLLLGVTDVAFGLEPAPADPPPQVAVAAPADAGASDAAVESPAATCAGFHETAQVRRMDGQLLEAREALLACAQETCPSFVRSDCVRWLDEIQAEIPTVVFEALGDDGLLTNVEVKLGDRVLTRALEGQPVEVPVGLSEFTFTGPSGEQKTLRVLLRQGETNRIVSADFRSGAASAAVPGATAAAAGTAENAAVPAPGPELLETRPIPSGVWLFGTTTLMATATTVTLGTIAQVKENNASTTCAPDCSDAVVSEIKSVALAADVALGVALAAGITTVVLYVVRPTVRVTRTDGALAQPGRGRHLAASPLFSAGPSAAWLGVEGTFQ